MLSQFPKHSVRAHFLDQGGYMLTDAATQATVAGAFYELTASDVLEWIEILSAAAEA